MDYEDDDLGLDGLRAARDCVLVRDARVMRNVLRLAEVAGVDYMRETQVELKPHMRRIVTEWMLEVCEAQSCHADVFPLAVHYVDRVLATRRIAKDAFQLLAATAIFIASKLKETAHITAEKLVVYADFSITMEEIMQWELLVLNELGWDLNTATAHTVLDHLLTCIDSDGPLSALASGVNLRLVRRHAETLSALASTDYNVSVSATSVAVAAGCLVAAFCGVSCPRGLVYRLLHALEDVTGLKQETMVALADAVEAMVRQRLPGAATTPSVFLPVKRPLSRSESTSSVDSVDQSGTNTPIDMIEASEACAF